MIDARIGNRSDALRVIDDVLELLDAGLLENEELAVVMESLRDAIEREVV